MPPTFTDEGSTGANTIRTRRALRTLQPTLHNPSTQQIDRLGHTSRLKSSRLLFYGLPAFPSLPGYGELDSPASGATVSALGRL